MTILFVGRISDSVQTEGHWHGTPTTIIRLMKMPEVSSENFIGLYVDPIDYPVPVDTSREISLSRMLKDHDPEEFARIGQATLWTLLKSRRGRHVIVTGPEPCEYELSRLTELLHGSGRLVQIETRGRVAVSLKDHVWLTLRPPAMRDGDLQVVASVLERANEIVARIHRPADVDRLDKLIASRNIPVWLIPSKDKFSASVCIEAASHRKWRVCGQRQMAVA